MHDGPQDRIRVNELRRLPNAVEELLKLHKNVNLLPLLSRPLLLRFALGYLRLDMLHGLGGH